MKLGSTIDLFSRYGEQRYEKMKQYGYSHLDFNLANTDSAYYSASEDEVKAMLKAEIDLAAASGVTIWQTHGPWRWPSKDDTEEDRAERMEKMKKSIHLTSLIGCKYWIVHPIMPHAIYERKDPEKSKSTWDINRTFMRELIRVAHEENVVICFENMPMPEFSLGKVEDIIKFVKEMDDPNFKICLDTGHAAVTKESVGDAVRAIGKDLLATLHVHDNNGIHDQHRLPYFGVIDWDDVTRALLEIGFDGVFNYELAAPKNMPEPYYEDIILKNYADIARHLMGEQ
jgi:sugar phosphate isomerase/epimerase